MRNSPDWKFWLLLAVVGILAGYGLGMRGLLPNVDITVHLPVKETGLYQPSGRLPDNKELTLVYVGSSSCRWSNADELPGLIERLKLSFQAQGFTAIGVASDHVAADGIEHLDGFGHFDEVLAGRSWANTGIAKYVYGDMPVPAATPQVIVLERTLERGETMMKYVIDRIHMRVSGLLGIKRLVERTGSTELRQTS